MDLIIIMQRGVDVIRDRKGFFFHLNMLLAGVSAGLLISCGCDGYRSTESVSQDQAYVAWWERQGGCGGAMDSSRVRIFIARQRVPPALIADLEGATLPRLRWVNERSLEVVVGATHGNLKYWNATGSSPVIEKQDRWKEVSISYRIEEVNDITPPRPATSPR
jgi:hypothetical protein